MVVASNKKALDELNNKNIKLKRRLTLFKILVGSALTYITITTIINH